MTRHIKTQYTVCVRLEVFGMKLKREIGNMKG